VSGVYARLARTERRRKGEATMNYDQEMKNMIERQKAILYKEFHEKTQSENPNLDMFNFLVEKLAEVRLVNTALSNMITTCLKKLGGLTNEGDEQTDVAQSPQGGDDASTDTQRVS
jgi:hypothetical protein